jgi:hypothetical protein
MTCDGSSLADKKLPVTVSDGADMTDRPTVLMMSALADTIVDTKIGRAARSRFLNLVISLLRSVLCPLKGGPAPPLHGRLYFSYVSQQKLCAFIVMLCAFIVHNA